jgi:hypothetical protein
MFLEELSWYQFSNLPNINKLPQHEQERQYRIYINEVTMQRFAMIQEQIQRAEVEALAQASQNGGGGHIQQEGLPSGCIEFVNNTSDGTSCTFWIETSAPTNYTITWGDGETSTGEVNGVDRLEVNYSYADSFTEYTARICFDDISLVTYLEFNGDD